ncbi:hypothetical protein SAMN02745136_05569 [Anaerocolumna jejuensis DSM 15929]|uniref:Uncharacterized protein n=1 Tax=Anaerocolumna jejuensis DSM 15929 TaxID=1121322 RepID=A0A1M7D029_9FIRM|nr:hypothetical protein [Anaerocolumna jejuensis]SHL72820.1 hypothetical protein SAMN02745136_05569 [Anaerocolumna jejuensis DSM 15929]
MELLEFAEEFPEIYTMLNDNVNDTIDYNNMNGEETLLSLDNMVDSLLTQYEENNYYGFDTVDSQQIDGFGRDGFGRDGRGRRRRRRRFREFNLRDILRLLFFRNLFDRRRH